MPACTAINHETAPEQGHACHALGRPRLGCYKGWSFLRPARPDPTAGQEHRMRRGTHSGLRYLRIAPVALLALLAAACSSAGTATTDGSSSFADRFRTAMASGSAPAPASEPGGPVSLNNCPNVELRQGAGTLTINNNPKDPSAMQLRYQVSVTQTARECSRVGGELIMRVGVQGRIVLGPAGTSGTLELPLRYAVVQESPEPKTVYTKLYRVPVSIAEGQLNVPFTHIEEGISVPMPSAAAFDSYVIYVGFDALGGAHPAKPPAKKRVPKQS